MRVLMLGWEFPPFISGGLGTACFGMTKALAKQGVKILFVLPQIKSIDRKSHVSLISASDVPVSATGAAGIMDFAKNIDFLAVDALLKPYLDSQTYAAVLAGVKKKNSKTGEAGTCLQLTGDYSGDLINEAIRYARVVGEIADHEIFDAIHGHDWLTAFAGAEAKRVSGKPFVYHAHALEYDRSGENINRGVYDIERFGMNAADHIIAVSHYTKNIIVNRYGISPDKISVVHNAVNREGVDGVNIPIKKERKRKIVLFLGRITFQKGPDYFIEAAAQVLKYIPDVTFVMAGLGDMRPRMIERVAQLKIGRNFHFIGFVEGRAIEQIYCMSDLYVMPSISEPFGISPLEAMLRDVPVIISKQSGVSEIVHNVLKVDFWDIKELANKIISVLKYPALSKEMVSQSRETLRTIHWEAAAEKISTIYQQMQ